jgi:ketosteroid isomerase-like protein
MTATTITPHDLNAQWRDAFNDGDLARLMTMYEPDAVLVPGPQAEPVTGHAAIEAALEWFLSLGGHLHYTPRHWLAQGDLVLASIAFVMEGGTDQDGNPVKLEGLTAEIARRQPDGTWKYVIDPPWGGRLNHRGAPPRRWTRPDHATPPTRTSSNARLRPAAATISTTATLDVV